MSMYKTSPILPLLRLSWHPPSEWEQNARQRPGPRRRVMAPDADVLRPAKNGRPHIGYAILRSGESAAWRHHLQANRNKMARYGRKREPWETRQVAEPRLPYIDFEWPLPEPTHPGHPTVC